MEQSEIIARVNRTLHDGFEKPLESLVPEATLYQDLGLDSLDAVDLMVHLEDNLGIKVDGEVFKDVRTLGDVYVVVERLTGEKLTGEKLTGENLAGSA